MIHVYCEYVYVQLYKIWTHAYNFGYTYNS